MPDEPAVAPPAPELSDAERWLQHYLAHRRRRRRLVAVCTLAGAGLLAIIVSGSRVLREGAATPKPAAIGPLAGPLRDSGVVRGAKLDPPVTPRDAAAGEPPSPTPPPAPKPPALPVTRSAAPSATPPPKPMAIEAPAVPPRESGVPRAAPPRPSATLKDRVPTASAPPSRTPPRAPKSPADLVAGPAGSPTAPGPSAPVARVSYHPRERLTRVQPGDTKERVLGLFGTTFARQNGSVVRMDGMRIRARGRSPSHGQVEVAEVTLAERTASRLYWFLFGDGRLLAWGQPEEWRAAAAHHQLEINYPAAPSLAVHGQN